MRIPSKSDEAEGFPAELPSEIQLWISKGWTLMPTERRGYVLSGQKAMRGIDKAGLVVGVLLLGGFAFGIILLGVLGILLVGVSWLDYQFNTRPPTKFFPLPGEKTRLMERE